jgi:uncharacterized protein YbjT (DUF2867 family)
MAKSLEVLVTGATGQQGGLVARMLLERGHKVRALTRNPSSPKAQELAQRGATLFQGDLEDRASLERALEGVDSLFLMSTPFEAGAHAEITQAVTAAEAARARGVKHLVYSSAAGANRPTGVEHFESKGEAERRLMALDVPYTIIGPGPFMDNVLAHWALPSLEEGKFRMPVPRHFKMQQVAVVDIARFAVLVLEQRERFLGKRIDIYSDAVSGQDMADTLSRVLGRPLEYVEASFAEINPLLGKLFKDAKPLARLPEGATADKLPQGMPHPVDLAALHREYPEVGWHTFEAWAREQDFSALR